jgi:hypothetical protein
MMQEEVGPTFAIRAAEMSQGIERKAMMRAAARGTEDDLEEERHGC